ncbi:MAG TPA: Smr/MutS family protein [Acetobacteraceae bacterium]|nr:Smr/MutS family protein [Acetobacteraceae bacterium]
MARRPRGLTEADRALWGAYAATVTPLPGRVPLAAPESATPPPVVVSPPPRPAAPAPPRPPSAIAVGTPPPGLDAKRWTALRRGRLRPERTLDLHGSRAQEAHAAVRGFLADAAADGVRCVAIVTGKGSTPEGGVLRRELPHWLNAPELRGLLLAAAHPHRANSGAVHLLLRRRR